MAKKRKDPHPIDILFPRKRTREERHRDFIRFMAFDDQMREEEEREKELDSILSASVFTRSDSLEEPEDDWKDNISIFDREYGVDPDDYDSEDEYLEAVENMRSSSFESDDDDTKKSPATGRTSDHVFRKDLYSIDDSDEKDENDPFNSSSHHFYHTDEEDDEEYLDDEDSLDDYEDSGTDWSDNYAFDYATGFDPEDYETEEEYLNDLSLEGTDTPFSAPTRSRHPRNIQKPVSLQYITSSRKHTVLPELSTAEETHSLPEPEPAPVERKPDTPEERRRKEAAFHLENLKKHPGNLSPEECKRQCDVCNLILEHGDTPAGKYLTVFRGFLAVQAAKENFTLPCPFPDETDIPRTNTNEFFHSVWRRDPKLALEIWAWWLREFTPYVSITPYPDVVHNSILYRWRDYKDPFLTELLEYMKNHEDFFHALLRDNPEVPCDCPFLILRALENNDPACACSVLKGFLSNPHVTVLDIEKMTDSCIRECRYSQKPQTMPLFRTEVYPLIRALTAPEITVLFAEWERTIDERLEELRKEKELEELRRQAQEERTQRQKKAEIESLSAATDDTIYGYCSVIFDNGTTAYSYRTGDLKPEIDDRVIVPVGKNGQETEATVVGVGKYRRIAAPYPVEKTSVILRIANKK